MHCSEAWVRVGVRKPDSFQNTVGGCLEEYLLWHLSFDEPSDDEAQRVLAFALRDRHENTTGNCASSVSGSSRRLEGWLDVRKAAD